MSTVLNRLIKKLDKRANKNSVKCHLFRKKERTDKEPSSTPVPKSAPPWAVEADGEQMSPLSTTPCRQSVTPTARSHSVTPTAQSHSVTPTARSHSVTPTAQSHSVTPTQLLQQPNLTQLLQQPNLTQLLQQLVHLNLLFQRLHVPVDLTHDLLLQQLQLINLAQVHLIQLLRQGH